MLLQAIRIHIREPINQGSGKSIENSQRNGSLKLLLKMNLIWQGHMKMRVNYHLRTHNLRTHNMVSIRAPKFGFDDTVMTTWSSFLMYWAGPQAVMDMQYFLIFSFSLFSPKLDRL
jgi:hypothetical protein